MEKLSLFFDQIKKLNFWQRLFSWRAIRQLSYEAYEAYVTLGRKQSEQQIFLDDLEKKLIKLDATNQNLESQKKDVEKRIQQKDNEIYNLNSKLDSFNEKNTTLSNEILRYESLKDKWEEDYGKKIAEFNQLKTSLEADRRALSDNRVREKQETFDKMKKTWSEHQTSVNQTIKRLCQTHLIKYIEKVPFRGAPDNTIEICDEYTIFDAKSPANDDLTNFPKYIRDQTDNVKKYANQNNVRKDVFLVIPSNTTEIIPQFSYNMGDYNVYVITLDALEPIILSLKKIEEYEFAEQLSPEDRDKICRVIGKFAHTTKRKIQIDQFFTNQYIDLLVKCKNDLPEDVLSSVIEFEKAEKLNPPTERRSKQILVKDLQSKNDSINVETQIREINIPQTFEDVKKLE